MDNKSILISEFIEKYNKSTDAGRVKLLKGIMKTDYCPIVTKRAMLQAALNKSSVEGNGIYYIDSLASKINFSVACILMYTSLEFDKTENGDSNVFEDYDLLMKNGLLDSIFSMIGESEINELGSVNTSLMDNFYNENTSMQAFLLKQINLMTGALLDSFSNGINNAVTDANLK